MFLILVFQLLILDIIDNVLIPINHEKKKKNHYYKYCSDIEFYHEFFDILLKFQYHCCYNVRSFLLIHSKILHLFSFSLSILPFILTSLISLINTKRRRQGRNRLHNTSVATPRCFVFFWCVLSLVQL